MKIIEKISGFDEKGCVLTIGNFDGVHIGHREILTAAKEVAAQKKTELMVMTFEPHPVVALQPDKTLGVLTPVELKKHLLAEFGVDCLFVLECSSEILSLSPRDFVDEFLVRKIRPSVVVEGEDFNFGSGRTGSVHTLYNLGAEKGFEVTIVSSKEIKLSIGHSVKVSSTMIRNLLEAGKVSDAAIALGRAYRLVGKIIPGRGKGKDLGFPTANMEVRRQIIPGEGVYAGFAAIAESFEDGCAAEEGIPAALSIGRSQTYGSSNRLLIEAHLLKENVGDLTGKIMATDFVERIRSQQKFETEKELAGQIAKDCEKTNELLKDYHDKEW